MSATEPPAAATFTYDPSLAKFDVQLEKYLAALQQTTPIPLYGIATGSIIFREQHHTSETNSKEEEPRVLLVQRSPTDSMPLRWEVPGGAVDAGETILAGAAREVREEAGLAVARIARLVVHRQQGGAGGGHAGGAEGGGDRGEGLDGGYLIRTTRGKRIPKYTFVVEVEDARRVRLDPAEHQDHVWATEAECRARRVVRRREGAAAGDEGGELGQGVDDVVVLEFTTEAQEDAILSAFAARRREAVGY